MFQVFHIFTIVESDILVQLDLVIRNIIILVWKGWWLKVSLA